MCCQVEVSAWADHSSRGLLPTAVCTNIVRAKPRNGRPLTGIGLQHHRKKLTKLTQCSRVLPEKQLDSQLVKKLPHFMELEDSLTHSKEIATCTYHEPDQSSSCFPIHYLKTLFNIILPSWPTPSKCSHSLRSPHKKPVCTCPVSRTGRCHRCL